MKGPPLQSIFTNCDYKNMHIYKQNTKLIENKISATKPATKSAMKTFLKANYDKISIILSKTTIKLIYYKSGMGKKLQNFVKFLNDNLYRHRYSMNFISIKYISI